MDLQKIIQTQQKSLQKEDQRLQAAVAEQRRNKAGNVAHRMKSNEKMPDYAQKICQQVTE